VIPTVLLLAAAVITFFQPREYSTSVFVDLDHPGVIPSSDPSIINLILLLSLLYLPGLLLIVLAWFFRRSTRDVTTTPAIYP
jgi:hypothetical protein